MSEAQLIVHTGGQLVTEAELEKIDPPEGTRSWAPTAHRVVLARVKEALTGAGYAVSKQQLAIADEGHRMFGTLDLAVLLHDEVSVSLAVGIRNSTNKTFPLGFCAGNRVFVCDNLAFSAELLVRRRHTTHGADHFQRDIDSAVKRLGSFKDAERHRIETLMDRELTDDAALAVLVRAMESKVIAAPSIPKVLKEWREPTHDYGQGDRPTAWRLLNAFTTALGARAKSNPNEYTKMTIRLNAMLAV
jgi:hypothetical protein